MKIILLLIALAAFAAPWIFAGCEWLAVQCNWERGLEFHRVLNRVLMLSAVAGGFVFLASRNAVRRVSCPVRTRAMTRNVSLRRKGRTTVA